MTRVTQHIILQSPADNDPLLDLNTQPSLDLQFATSKTLDDRVSGLPLVDHQRDASGSNSPGTYVGSDGLIKTSTVNLITYSEEFDNTNWAKTASTVAPNATSAPNGQNTADSLIESTATSQHTATQFVSVSSGLAYTFTVYAKANGRNYCDLGVTTPIVTTSCYVRFTLSGTGSSVLRQGSPIPTHSITALPNGWYRCQITITTTSAGSGPFQVSLAPDATSSPFYTGDGTSGVYVWGAQLEEGDELTEYIPTTSTISGAPRFDHDPTTGESLGLLIEESRTNLVTYSEEFDPANTGNWWSLINSATVSRDNQTSPNGEPNSATLLTAPNFGALGKIGLSLPAECKISFYAKLSDTTADGWAVLGASGTTSFTPTLEWQRFTFTIPNTATQIQIRNTSGGTRRIYIWGVQLEAGAFPTSYIPTSGSTVTRAADVAEITGSNFSRWYNQSEGTVFVEATSLPGNISFTMAQLSADGDFFPLSITLDRKIDSSGAWSFYYRDYDNSVFTNSSSSYTGESGSMAVAFSSSGLSGSVNGESVLTASPTTRLSDLTTLGIGRFYNDDSMGGHIKRLTYYPYRLPDATLQEITS